MSCSPRPPCVGHFAPTRVWTRAVDCLAMGPCTGWRRWQLCWQGLLRVITELLPSLGPGQLHQCCSSLLAGTFWKLVHTHLMAGFDGQDQV